MIRCRVLALSIMTLVFAGCSSTALQFHDPAFNPISEPVASERVGTVPSLSTEKLQPLADRIRESVPDAVEPCSATEVDKYQELGRLYRQKYASDLVFGAAVEVEKLKASMKLVEKSLTSGVLSKDPIRARASTEYSALDRESQIQLQFSPPTYRILDPVAFYKGVITDEFLSYFTLKKKVGSWWAFLDLSEVVAWEAYFWQAYLIEAGLEPEYATDLNMLVLGNFATAEEALLLKQRLPEAPVEVGYVVFDAYPATDSVTVKPLSKLAPSLKLSEKEVQILDEFSLLPESPKASVPVDTVLSPVTQPPSKSSKKISGTNLKLKKLSKHE